MRQETLNAVCCNLMIGLVGLNSPRLGEIYEFCFYDAIILYIYIYSRIYAYLCMYACVCIYVCVCMSMFMYRQSGITAL